MILLYLLIGIIAGLRAMTAPAAIAWAVHGGTVDVDGTLLEFLGYRFTPWIFSALALAELVTDTLPRTPSRKSLPQFVTRLIMGGIAGGAIGASAGMLAIGLGVGMIGAVLGTIGGAAARARLAAWFGGDRPAALIEDAVALAGAALIVLAL